MTDLLTILLALVIIASLVGFFGFLAWKMNMSDPLNDDETSNSNSEKNKKKEKNSAEQGKKKQQQQQQQQRKDQKKSKRENKDEEQQQQQQQKSTKSKTKEQTSEETDEDRDESEQDAQPQVVETSSKARKRNKNKARASTPPPPSSSSNSTRVPPVTHPKSTGKDELESSKTQSKNQTKQTTTKKVTTQSVEKHEEEQPFTVVGANRHKNTTSQQQQQQQTKPQVTPAAPVQQVTVASVQPEPQRVKESVPAKQVTIAPVQPEPQRPKESVSVKQAATTPKVADLIKVLPSSQVVVTELMTALDAFPLATNELDIIMRKIENKQWLLNKDWSKPKVDSQVTEDDLKNNSVQRMKELTDQLNNEKRRNQELLKEQTDKNREIQILHAQLDKTESNPNQSKVQNLELQLKRLTEENRQLSTAPTTNNNSSNVQVQVLSEQMKKLSVDNANWEKKAHSNELLAREAQQEKEDLIRNNEQLTEALKNAEKDLKHIEEKHHRQVNDNRTSHFNELNELKQRIEQLQTENEQLRREDIVHVEPPSADTDLQTITVNTEERERLEKDIEQLKQVIDDNQRKFHEDLENLRNERRTQENEIERLKQEKVHAEHQTNESHQVELNALRTELKSTSEANQRQVLTDLLSEDLRHQLPHDTSNFEQWLSSYRQLSESNKRHVHEETSELKRDKERLQKNMHEIEKQLKEIETTLENKEESLLTELQSKDAIIENLHHENEQINGELGNLRTEVQRLQTAHDASVTEARTLKHQLDERILVANNTPSAVDESFELVKQPTPSLSPIVIDIRAEHLNPHETITHETSTSDHPQ